MEKEPQLRYVNPEYHKTLKKLASLLCTQVETEYHPAPIMVEDDLTGYDSEGNYHCPLLRTERQ